MIVLLGATGYIGQALRATLRAARLAFVAPSRGEMDYTRFDVLLEFLRRDQAGFLDQRRRLHRQTQRGCLRRAPGRHPARQHLVSRDGCPCLRHAGRALGPCFLRLHLRRRQSILRAVCAWRRI